MDELSPELDAYERASARYSARLIRERYRAGADADAGMVVDSFKSTSVAAVSAADRPVEPRRGLPIPFPRHGTVCPTAGRAFRHKEVSDVSPTKIAR